MVGTFQLNVSQIPASLFSLPLSCPSFLSFARTKSCLLNFSNTLCLFDPSTCLELQKKLGKWHCELYISPGRGGIKCKLCWELLKETTFPCKGRQWSRFLSSFQESIWTSASPRKVFLPKRPWCHTENCKVLWARRDSGISYCERKGDTQDD